MIFENNIGVQMVIFFAPKIINNLFHEIIFWTVCMYKFGPSEISWCVAKCLTEGSWWYSETS